MCAAKYLNVDNHTSCGTRQIARVFLGADYEHVLVLAFVIETADSFYDSGLRVYAKEFSIPLPDRVCNLLLCVRIIGLEMIALPLKTREAARPIPPGSCPFYGSSAGTRIVGDASNANIPLKVETSVDLSFFLSRLSNKKTSLWKSTERIYFQ